MSNNELLRVELALWKAIAASRERQRSDTERFFDIAVEIANYWRGFAPADADYPSALKAKIEALAP